ncbi:MAG: hypothetical protein WC307_04780 [Candidatus Nanoarchaeia archaeon]|jgi:hypothetical protein
MKNWTGAIIEDGLLDVSVMDHVGILNKWVKELGISDMWTVIEVTVDSDEIKTVEAKLLKGLRPGWYAYFKRGDRVLIIFKGKSFNIKKGSQLSLSRVKNWAFKKYNLLPEVFTLNF